MILVTISQLKKKICRRKKMHQGRQLWQLVPFCSRSWDLQEGMSFGSIAIEYMLMIYYITICYVLLSDRPYVDDVEVLELKSFNMNY